MFCDILWADPVDNEEGICEGEYRVNDNRGCSFYFGAEAAYTFLERNCLISIIRAHEAQIDGLLLNINIIRFKMHRWGGQDDFPLVITVFSAPNYCDIYNNKGAIIKFEVLECNSLSNIRIIK